MCAFVPPEVHTSPESVKATALCIQSCGYLHDKEKIHYLQILRGAYHANINPHPLFLFTLQLRAGKFGPLYKPFPCACNLLPFYKFTSFDPRESTFMLARRNPSITSYEEYLQLVSKIHDVIEKLSGVCTFKLDDDAHVVWADMLKHVYSVKSKETGGYRVLSLPLPLDKDVEAWLNPLRTQILSA